MFRALIDWLSRDWASRKYNPVFAFAQRLVWYIPAILSLAMIGVLDGLDFPRDSLATLVVVALGVVGTLAIMLLSLYRWGVGYSRSEFQDRAAAEHRSRFGARKLLVRQWFKRNVR